jgi:hypothetical protein
MALSSYEPATFISSQDVKVGLFDHSHGKLSPCDCPQLWAVRLAGGAAKLFIDNRDHAFFDPSTFARIDRIAAIVAKEGEDFYIISRTDTMAMTTVLRPTRSGNRGF